MFSGLQGEKTAQTSLHSKDNHLFGSDLTFPSSCLMGRDPPRSMGSFGFPGRMVPHRRVLATLVCSVFVDIRVWPSNLLSRYWSLGSNRLYLTRSYSAFIILSQKPYEFTPSDKSINNL